MNKSNKIKLASAICCFSGLTCAFFTGMFLASSSLTSLPAIFMGLSTVTFLISIFFYILWSR